MTRIFLALTIVGTVALSLPVQASSAERDGIQNLAQYEFSSRHRGSRHGHVARFHYYDPYPWWWYPPYVKRARTNYLGCGRTHSIRPITTIPIRTGLPVIPAASG